jgi:hypothetical protein
VGVICGAFGCPIGRACRRVRRVRDAPAFTPRCSPQVTGLGPNIDAEGVAHPSPRSRRSRAPAVRSCHLAHDLNGVVRPCRTPLGFADPTGGPKTQGAPLRGDPWAVTCDRFAVRSGGRRAQHRPMALSTPKALYVTTRGQRSGAAAERHPGSLASLKAPKPRRGCTTGLMSGL